MKKQRLFLIAAILSTLFIFGNSMMSAEYSNIGSGVIVDAVENTSKALGTSVRHAKTVVFVRKSAHVLEFALQGFLLAGCFSGKFRKRIIYVLFFGLMTACVDEYIQLFSNGRSSMVQDVFIDFAGTVLGIFVFWLFCEFLGKRKG